MATVESGAKRRALPVGLAVAAAGGHLVLALLGVVGVVLIGGRSAWEFLQEGGWLAWLLLAGGVFALVAVGFYGAVAVVRQRLPGWPLVAVGSFVALLGALGVYAAMSRVDEAVASAAVAPEQRAALFAAGLAESLTLSTIGALGGCVLLSAAASVLGALALSRAPTAAFGKSAVAALGMGGVVLVFAVLARLVYEPLSWGLPLGILPALSGMAGALLGALALDSRAADEQARARALGDVLLCAVAATGAAALAAAVVEHLGVLSAFGAVAAAPPDRKLELMGHGWAEARQAFVAHLVYAAPALAAAAGVMLVRLASLGRAVAVAWLGALVSVVCILLPVGLAHAQLGSSAERLVGLWTAPLPDDVELVRVAPSPQLGPSGGRLLLVGKRQLTLDGSQLGPASELDSDRGCNAVAERIDPADRLVIGLDAGTPYRRMACLMRAATRRRGVARDRSSRKPPGEEGIMGAPSPPDGPLRGPLLGPSAYETMWLVEQEMTDEGARAARPLPAPFDELLPPRATLRSTTAAGEPLFRRVSSRTVHVLLAQGRCWLLDLHSREAQDHEGDEAQLVAWLRDRVERRVQVLITAQADVPASLVLSVMRLGDLDLPVVLGPAAGELAPGVRELTADEQRWLELFGDGTGRRIGQKTDFGVAADGEERELGLGLGDLLRGTSGLSAGGGSPDRKAKVVTASPTVAGRLSPEIIQRIVRQQRARIRFCYQQGLKDNPDLTGRVVVQFVIGRDGRVSAAKVRDSTVDDPEVAKCVVRVFSRMVFPSPEGGIVTVSYPLVFESA